MGLRAAALRGEPLPFPPLLPKQILLVNRLADPPEMTIATDNVDPEVADRPRRGEIGFLRMFMIVFGLVSSLFDYATFVLLLRVLRAGQNRSRTGSVPGAGGPGRLGRAGGAHPAALLPEPAGVRVAAGYSGSPRRERPPYAHA